MSKDTKEIKGAAPRNLRKQTLISIWA